MTKPELTKALFDAHSALAIHLAAHHSDIRNARRAMRRHGRDAFIDDLRAAVRNHGALKHRISLWMQPAQVAEVRSAAARFIRDDLASSRRLYPRAFPAAAPLALAA